MLRHAHPGDDRRWERQCWTWDGRTFPSDDRALAEDAAQECLLRIVPPLSQYRHEAKFATWATRVAVNAVLDFKNGVAREARNSFEHFANQLDAGLDESAVERPEDALLLKQ